MSATVRRPYGAASRTAATALAVLALAAPQPAAAAELRGGFTSEGDCVQLAAFVPVPVSRVRSMVPEGFAIVGEEAGAALVLVTGGRCDPWFLNGQPAPAFEFGLVSVVAHPRGAAPGPDGYDRWWLIDDAATHKPFRSIGVFSRLVPGVSFELTKDAAGGVAGGSVSVPWRDSPFSIEGTVVDTPSPALEFPSRHWYEGPRGRVRSDHTNTAATIDAALLTIRTPPDSPLGRILGAGETTIPGGLLRFHHEAVWGIESP